MKIDMRYALLGESTRNFDTSRNIKVYMKIKGNLPIISYAQSSGSGNVTEDVVNPRSAVDVTYNTEIAKAGVLWKVVRNKIKNIPVDPDDKGRYKLFGLVASMVTEREGYLVYDSKYKDILLIPTLLEIGDSDKTKDIFRGNSFTIDAYTVGNKILGNTGNNIISSKIKHPSDSGSIPPPIRPIDTVVRLMNLGVANSIGIDDNYGIAFGTVYIETTRNKLAQMVSLGSTKRLFNDKVFAYRLIKNSFSSIHPYSMGRVELDDMMFFLPF
jgi:hypothetical protein